MGTNFKLSFLFFTITLLFMFSLTAEANSEVSFSAELIHRDSPLSPFYNPSQTYSDRLHNAFIRSISRARHFSRRSKSLQSQLLHGAQGEILMKISIGTPPKTIVGVADTGSGLIWTQCKPCEQCFNQTVHPIFDPRKSKSYRDLPCSSSSCKALSGFSSCSAINTCKYRYSYVDESYTEGNIATETVTMLSNRGGPVSLPGFVVGCGHKNGGLFDESGSGIIGLGRNSLSLVSQLGNAHNISKQFSYCLLPPSSNVTSKIIFGGANVVSGPGTVSTPLIPNKKDDTSYYLTLEAISVGNKKLAYAGSSAKGGGRIPKKGNIIIDSGTTSIFLDSKFYKKLEKVLAEELGGKRVKEPSSGYSYCFKEESVAETPVIKAHFTGAKVEMKQENVFRRVKEGVICLAVVPSEEGTAYFGYVAQSNWLVAYDLGKKTVSFTPTECAKH